MDLYENLSYMYILSHCLDIDILLVHYSATRAKNLGFILVSSLTLISSFSISKYLLAASSKSILNLPSHSAYTATTRSYPKLLLPPVWMPVIVHQLPLWPHLKDPQTIFHITAREIILTCQSDNVTLLLKFFKGLLLTLQ